MPRPRKPDALHALAGTRSGAIGAGGIVELPPATLAAPAGLSETERALWARAIRPLAKQQVLTAADLELARLLVGALADMERAREVLDGEGRTIEATTDRGGKALRPHPLVKVAEDAARRAQSILEVFLRRVRVTPPAPKNPDDPVEQWLRRHDKMRRRAAAIATR